MVKGWAEAEFLSIKSSSVGENTRAVIWNKHQLLLRSPTAPVIPPLHALDTPIRYHPRFPSRLLLVLEGFIQDSSITCEVDVLLPSDSALQVFVKDVRGVKFYSRSTHDGTTVV